MSNLIVLDTETDNKNPHKVTRVLGVSTHENGVSSFSPSAHGLDLEGKRIVGHNIKYDLVVLHRLEGFPLSFFPQVYADTMIMYYILHIDKPRKLETILKEVFGENKKDLVEVYNECSGKDRTTLPEDWYCAVSLDRLSVYAQEDAESTYRLFEKLQQELKEQPHLEKWFYEVEMPVMRILTEMELRGVYADRSKLITLENTLNTDLEKCKKKLDRLIGREINLNSSKQLQELLYDELKLPKLKKTKTGISTDNETLCKLADNAVPKLICDYREMEKLLGTYVRPTLEQLDTHSRLHTTYNQSLTVTRRFSSQEPNLQNIPARGTYAERMRRCFCAPKGKVLLTADYSQIEYRVVTHVSQEPVLVGAYNSGSDMHDATMRLNKTDRNTAKIINFSILYGTTSTGLARTLKCSTSEAQEMLDTFFKTYKTLTEWMHHQEAICKRNNGWVKDFTGLPLYCGNPNTNDKWAHTKVMRHAVNYPIQCGSQSILKKAMVDIKDGTGLAPVLMVHDELVYELDENYTEGQPEAIISIMKEATKLSIPVEVSWKLSNEWEK